jgi:Protein of unknown function (DUF3073)
MGRGRAKAKQVKVARQLKYSGGGTDLDRLRAELGVSTDEQEAAGQSAHADFGDRYSVDDEEYDDELGDDEEFDVDALGGDPADDYGHGNGGPAPRMTRTTGG